MTGTPQQQCPSETCQTDQPNHRRMSLDDTHRKIQDRLKKLSYLISHANEQCEAKAQEINSYVRMIAASGILEQRIIPGPVLIDRAYTPEANRQDSAIVYQAALHTRQG